MQDFDENGYDRPSKSSRKRESQSLQDLGVALIDMPDAQFNALPLPDALRDAVLAARRIKSHGARLRQHQYIGKVMRKIDVEPIRAALQAQEEAHRTQARRFKRIEAWRDRLIAEGEPALAEFVAAFPQADGAGLRALIAQARHERERKFAPKSSRVLFVQLKSVLESGA